MLMFVFSNIALIFLIFLCNLLITLNYHLGYTAILKSVFFPRHFFQQVPAFEPKLSSEDSSKVQNVKHKCINPMETPRIGHQVREHYPRGNLLSKSTWLTVLVFRNTPARPSKDFFNKKPLSAPEWQLAGLQVCRHVSALNERRQLLEVHRVTTLLCRMSRPTLTDSCAAKG